MGQAFNKTNSADHTLLESRVDHFNSGQFSYHRESVIPKDALALIENGRIDKVGELTSRFGTGTHSTANQRLKGVIPFTGFTHANYASNTPIGCTFQRGTLKLIDEDGTLVTVASTTAGIFQQISWAQIGPDIVFTWINDTGQIFDTKIYDASADSLIDTGLGVSKTAKFVAKINERVVIGGEEDGNDINLRFSDVLDATTFPAIGDIQPHGDESDKLVGAIQWIGNYLFVGCQRSLWTINCDELLYDATNGAANWPIARVSSDVGLMSHSSLAVVGRKVFGLFTDGVREIIRNDEDTISTASLPISKPIEDIIRRIEPGYEIYSEGVYYNKRYYLSLVVDGATKPNIMIVWNEESRCWEGSWDFNAGSDEINSIGSLVLSGKDQFFVTTFDSSLDARLNLYYDWDDGTFTDRYRDYDGEVEETTYITKVRTGAMNFQAPDNEKWGDHIELYYELTEGTAEVYYILDNGTATSLGTLSTTTGPSYAKFNIRHLDVFRELQIEVRSTEDFKLRSIAAFAHVNPIRLEDE